MSLLTTAVSPGGEVVNSTDTEKANAIVAEQTLTIIYIIIGCISLLGNTFVLVVIFNNKAMRKMTTNMYILNQSLVDGCVALFLILTSIFEDRHSRSYSGAADEALCRLWYTKMPLWGLLVASTYNLVALTIERYLAIVHPIWHKMKFNRTCALASMGLAWFVGIFYNMAFMIPTAGILDNGSCTVYSIYPNDMTAAAVGVLTIVVQYFIPLTVLCFCYTRMVLVLKRKSPTGGGEEKTGQQPGAPKKVDSMARARKNIIKTLLLVAFCFIFCWTWNQIYFLMFNLGYPYIDFTSTFYHFTVVMVFCNCCINPFIYIAKYDQIKSAMKKFLCRGNRVQDMPDGGATGSTTQ